MVLYAVVKTVRQILREIAFLAVSRTIARAAPIIACQTIPQTVFCIALHTILPIISETAWGMR